MKEQVSPVPTQGALSQPRPRRLAIVFLTAATMLVLAVLTDWIPQAALNAGGRKVARLRLLMVSMALVSYSDVYGHLPYQVVRQESASQSKKADLPKVTGGPLYSWRVEIVPFLESWHGTWDPSQPWDSRANGQLAELSWFYAFDPTGPYAHLQSFPETNLLAITGPGTAFGDGEGRPMALKDVPPATIIAVETRSSGIPWPAPGDFDIRTMPRTVCARDGSGISSRIEGGFHLIFADGRVWLLSDKVPFGTLSKFFTTSDAEKHDREQLLGPFVLHRGL